MYGPAGFEDCSDDDEFDFGEGGFQLTSNYRPAQSKLSTPAEPSPRQNVKQHNDKSTSGMGRGRGVLGNARDRGGFPSPGQNSNVGRGQRSPFAKKARQKPAKAKDPSPNPILLEDLKVAAIKDSAETVAKLLDQGITTDYVLASGWTALMHAARNASDNVVELLLKRGANANYQKDMFTVLMAVCDCDSAIDEENVLHCVELLLDHGAKTGLYDRHRMSPLIYAARQGRVMVCERLLQKGAQINKTDARGWTALSWAASRGHGRLIRILLDHKADPKLYTLDGQSPSDIAYTNGYYTISGILEAAASGTLGNRAEILLSSSEDDKAAADNSTLERYGELEVLLCGLQLGHLVPKFQEHKITFQGFAKMTEKDLDQIGITQVGVRQKILEAIRDIHVKDWDMSSLQRQQTNMLSAQEVTTVIANVGKHLSVIEASVVYAHKQLDSINEPTGFIQDVAEAEGLVYFAKDALQNVASLQQEIDSLQTRCHELSSQSHLLSADLIPPVNTSNSTSKRGLLLVGLATITLGIICIRKFGLPLATS